jgi:hypothetical protein
MSQRCDKTTKSSRLCSKGESRSASPFQLSSTHVRASSSSPFSHTFNFQHAEFEGVGGAKEHLFFMCMCDESFGRSRPFAFLKELQGTWEGKGITLSSCWFHYSHMIACAKPDAFRKLFPKISSSDPSTYHSFSSVMAQKLQQHSNATAPDPTISTIQSGLDVCVCAAALREGCTCDSSLIVSEFL